MKVVGSNISHKLRFSSVKASDEGTYECRVIDNSGAVAQHHRVRAYLQVNSQESHDVRLQEARQWRRGSHQTSHAGSRRGDEEETGWQPQSLWSSVRFVVNLQSSCMFMSRFYMEGWRFSAHVSWFVCCLNAGECQQRKGFFFFFKSRSNYVFSIVKSFPLFFFKSWLCTF